MKRIYLDHAASTPLAPGVKEAMEPWLFEQFGNASALYEEGRKAKNAIDMARERLSGCLGCEFGEIVFTSSGTESVNLALVGTALAHRGSKRRRILLGASEHHSVLETSDLLCSLGFTVQLIPVDSSARIRFDWLEENVSGDVLFVSVQSANNETGVLQPVEMVAQICRSNGVIFHCDAIQSFDGHPIPGDLVSLSGHKFGGPKGVGALFVRAGTKVTPLNMGGGQEREMRAGTENVAAIVGFGAAVGAMDADSNRKERVCACKDLFSQEVKRAPLWEATIDSGKEVLPGHCHGRFRGISAESLLIRLDRVGVSASSGAACSSGSVLPSHVMIAAGWSEKAAKEALRFTFGWNSTEKESLLGSKLVLEAVHDILA